MYFILHGTTKGGAKYCAIGQLGPVTQTSTVKKYAVKSISSGKATYLWNIQECWGIVGSEGPLSVTVKNCHLCHTLKEAQIYAPFFAGCSY
jgi:hypothetical protein